MSEDPRDDKILNLMEKIKELESKIKQETIKSESVEKYEWDSDVELVELSEKPIESIELTDSDGEWLESVINGTGILNK